MPTISKNSNEFYDLIASQYDLMYKWKDYKKEAALLEKYIRTYLVKKKYKLLDLACGTGEHHRFLSKKIEVQGLDLNKKMLQIARKKNPNISYKHGDMTSFTLKEKYDVVTCLFSSIGHLRSYTDFEKMIACVVQHLNPGGVFLIEPFIDKKDFKKNFNDARLHVDGPQSFCRIALSQMRGNNLELNFHCLYSDGKNVHYTHAQEYNYLFQKEKLLQIMTRHGLSSTQQPEGLLSYRGLLIGVLPA